MLRICNLTKTYKGGKLAVDDLSLEISAGDIFGFIGHNGAGKSTTIKSVVGILEFDSGEIYVNGISVKDDPITCKKMIAYIPDNPDIYEYLTGMQYLDFISDIFGISAQERTSLIDKYAEMFEIKDNLGQLVSSYSHGMKQKLAIIAALIHKPKLLVMDEPFVGLDPKSSHTLKMLFAEFCSEGGAIFFSTHVLEVAQKLCNKIAIIKNGKLVVSGNTEDVLQGEDLEKVFLEITE